VLRINWTYSDAPWSGYTETFPVAILGREHRLYARYRVVSHPSGKVEERYRMDVVVFNEALQNGYLHGNEKGFTLARALGSSAKDLSRAAIDIIRRFMENPLAFLTNPTMPEWMRQHLDPMIRQNYWKSTGLWVLGLVERQVWLAERLRLGNAQPTRGNVVALRPRTTTA